MKNIPITFVTPWYGYFSGGAEVAVRSLAEELVKREFTVQVLTTCCPSPFDNWWRNVLPADVTYINGVTVRRFPVNTQGEELYHEANHQIINGMKIDEKYQLQFVKYSINSQPLIDYANTNTQGHMVIAIPYLYGLTYSLITTLKDRIGIIPCLHDEHQISWTTTAEMFMKSQYFFFLTPEEKTLAIKNFGCVVGRKLIESPVIGVGVELPHNIRQILRMKAQKARNSINDKYNLPDNFFVYVGRKDIGKNILLLINYFKDYRGNGGDASIVFLGGGDSNLVPTENGFIDLGFLPEEDKYLIISQAQGLINLSYNESFSLVLMEAWLCEIPVIVHQKSDVTNGHCLKSRGGISIASSQEFQNALTKLTNKSQNNNFASLGKHYVESNYSWDSVIDRFLRGTYQ